MSKIKSWISAARPRTLPLTFSGIVVGAALALRDHVFDTTTFVLALLTTLGFQVLSNFANDYGDGVKGTDNDDRIGPMRALQSGAISPAQMKKAIIFTSIFSLVCALALIWHTLSDVLLQAGLYILLGVACIAAAIKYTVGSNAYGYKGMGDIAVFVFFGLVSVLGSYYLYNRMFPTLLDLLPAICMGLLSAGVLNLNNMRDRISDAAAGKNTLVVGMGGPAAVAYHTILILGAIACIAAYLHGAPVKNQWIIYIGFIPLLIHLTIVLNAKEPSDYDPQLKVLALSTFLLAILFIITMALAYS